MRPLWLLLLLFSTADVQALSDAELDRVGRRVWQNECGGSREGLTSWNAGENFASLGIGHFIWYPRGVDGPFEESFPKLVAFLKENGVQLPAWLKPDLDCPWDTRDEFQRDLHSARMNELRDMLASTIRWQSRFLANRLQSSLSKMLGASRPGEKERVRQNLQELMARPGGMFALIDYVNFKGEGTNPKERYAGEGWGLLQVLAHMDRAEDARPEQRFAESASAVLTRRVQNSPPARNEARWLPGWKNRVRAYATEH